MAELKYLRIIASTALLFILVGSACAATITTPKRYTPQIITTTTTSLVRLSTTQNNIDTTSDSVRCEAVSSPSQRTCQQGLCPKGTGCRYVASATTAYGGYCKCVDLATTSTTLSSQLYCEKVEDANERTCREGYCRPDQVCKYVRNSDNVGRCQCIPAATTTTIYHFTWCRDIENPSQRMCMRGLCPPNTVCRLRSLVTNPATNLIQAANLQTSQDNGEGPQLADSFSAVYTTINVDTTGCICVPCQQATTTTLPQKCERIDQANQRTCSLGVCPSDARCVYKPGAQQTGYLAAVVTQGTCECVKGTTTTLPERCEALDNAGVRVCAEGICPKPYSCRYVPSLSAANMGACKCVPPTTTTKPTDIRCEAVEAADRKTCETGICPQDSKCRFVAGATSADSGSCMCIRPPTTTTLPYNVKCQEIQDATQDTCDVGVCPEGKKCEVITYNFGSTQVSQCVCADQGTATTTTQPGQVKCEAIDDASQATCETGLCPPETECEYIKYVFGSTMVENCVCVQDQQQGQTPHDNIRCEAVDDPSANTCALASCPQNSLCRVTTDDAGNEICKCMPTNMSLQKRQGLLARMWDSLFG